MTRHEIDVITQYLLDNAETIDFPGSEVKFRYIPIDVAMKLADIIDDGDYAQRTHISDDYSLDDVVTLLSDGLSMECGFCGVDYKIEDYGAARESLLDKGVREEALCHELVEAEMMLIGKDFWLIESEADKRHLLTIEKIIKGLDMYVKTVMNEIGCTKTHAIIKALDEGDFCVYNSILQMACFGEVVYG